MRKATFLALEEEHNPNVTSGCESYLDKSYHTYNLFPNASNAIRKDRLVGGRGVFSSLKNHLQVIEKTQFSGLK